MIASLGIIKNEILMWSEKQLIISNGKRTSLKLVKKSCFIQSKNRVWSPTTFYIRSLSMVNDRDQP